MLNLIRAALEWMLERLDRPHHFVNLITRPEDEL